MNPVGKVPVMVDTESPDLTIFESGAMVQYLLDRYGNGQLQPQPGTPAHALYLQWSWFAGHSPDHWARLLITCASFRMSSRARRQLRRCAIALDCA